MFTLHCVYVFIVIIVLVFILIEAVLLFTSSQKELQSKIFTAQHK